MNMRLHSGRFIYRGNKQLGKSLVITKRYSFDKNNTFLVCFPWCKPTCLDAMTENNDNHKNNRCLHDQTTRPRSTKCRIITHILKQITSPIKR